MGKDQRELLGRQKWSVYNNRDVCYMTVSIFQDCSRDLYILKHVPSTHKKNCKNNNNNNKNPEETEEWMKVKIKVGEY